MKHEYKIYQLDAHDENVLKDHKMYESWEMLNRTAGFNFRQYKLVWEDEIEVYESRYQSDMRQILELNRNPKAMERIARERYFMKHDDEDIFVLSDDDRDVKNLIEENEPAE